MPERFCGGVSLRRGAISSVCTFSFTLPLADLACLMEILRNECSISATGDAVCNTTLTEFSGVIQSPNFPYTYERQTSCAWVIETTRGNTINASFSQFDLQPRLGRSCFADYVEVRNRLYSPPLTPVDQWYGLRPSVLGQDRSQTKKNRSWSWSCRSGVVLWNTVLLRSSS